MHYWHFIEQNVSGNAPLSSSVERVGRHQLTCARQKQPITVTVKTVIGLVYCLLTGCAVVESSFLCWIWLSRCSLILLHEDGNRFCASKPVACWHTLSSDWEKLFLFDPVVLIHPYCFTWGWQHPAPETCSFFFEYEYSV